MTYDFRVQRLFVAAPLAEGALIEPDRAQANYLLNVLRLREGDAIHLFNGTDGEWRATIEAPTRRACRLVVGRQLRPQTPLAPVRYLFAPLKQARLDYMVQKAVEMGAGRLSPVLTQHTQVSRLNLDRMRANVVEAAEQCGILALPPIDEAQKLAQLLDRWDPAERLVFCDEDAPSAEPARAFEGIERGTPIALLVGPEGGFSAEERERIRVLPDAVPLSLGPRILRADTAAVAALALVQAFIGDWR
jgi:16S rRNA (uracil1498-N3)-methyltransferase